MAEIRGIAEAEISMKLWISKYALSKGIKECDMRVVGGWACSMSGAYYKLWRDAHETKEQAISAAEEMRIKKIESIKKQIAKLEKMTFS